MEKDIFRKTLVVGMIVLFLGLAVASSTAVVPNIKNMANNEWASISFTNGKTIYVDDDNTEGPWDGTLEHPFRIIQDGINIASSGDTVFVFSGMYECIVINKTINLVGENKHDTVIHTTNCDPAVMISIDGSSVKKFTIKADILCISMSSYHNNLISDNILTGLNAHIGNSEMLPWDGIALGSSTYNIISDNAIMDRGNGIVFQGSSNNIIFGNVITNCAVGIFFEWWCNNNTILRNKITGSAYWGLKITESSNSNIIYHNNFINNNPNAYDECINIWDDDYPSGGNYWDDYTGVDEDEDGIGDTPYNIPSGSSQDRYPLMEPYIFPKLEIFEVTSGIGVSATIKNVGEGDANDVRWNITFEGGLIVLPRKNADVIPTLAANESVDIKMWVFGIGLGKLTDMPVITITANAPDSNTAEEMAIAKLLGPFVILQ